MHSKSDDNLYNLRELIKLAVQNIEVNFKNQIIFIIYFREKFFLRMKNLIFVLNFTNIFIIITFCLNIFFFLNIVLKHYLLTIKTEIIDID